LNNSTEVNSPSDATEWTGKMLMVGLMKGVKDNGYLATEATKDVAENVLNGFSDVAKYVNDILDGTLDSDPVIRPVLDLTDLKNGAAKVDGMFATKKPLFSGTVTRNLNAISDAQTMPEGTNAPTTETINFTQNNYSPKALNAIEIYRQTRNQLSAVKGRVGAR